MSLKQELETWSDALAAFDRQDHDTALSLFHSMDPSSKIHFNVGLIHATRGHHELAIEAFERSIELDPYLAVAYFQVGVSRFLLQQYDDARKDFDDAWLYLRGNETIDYRQIGLDFQLYSCETLFNRGLCLVYMNRIEEGLCDWTTAMKEKSTQEHDVIDEAFLDRGRGYTVFSVSVGTVFRPSESKLANLASRNFLGQATVIAARNPFDLHLDFYRGPTSKDSHPDAIPTPETRQKGSTTLSRSRTAAARLERSVDGVARPLRRRPTLHERKASESQLKRSQTAPAAAGTADVTADKPNARRLAFQVISSRSDYPNLRPPKLPIPPDSQPRGGSCGGGLDKSAANIVEMISGSAPSSNAAQPTTGNEKRSRRIGLRIAVPPVPPTLSLSPTTCPDSGDRAFIRRSASLHSPRPPPTLVPIESNLRTPHSRSASLPSPNLLPSSGTLETLSPQRHHPRKTTPDPSDDPRQVTHKSPHGAHLPPISPTLQHAPPSSCVPVEHGPRCMSTTDGAGGKGLLSVVSASVNSGSALLAYLQDVESLRGSEGSGNGQTSSDKTSSDKGVGREEEGLKLRIRLRYRGQIRAMIVPMEIDIAALAERVRIKLKISTELTMSYRDSDGCVISIVDQEDWQSVLDAVLFEDPERRRVDVVADDAN
ncbi:hypothetical protein JCM11491_005631 [Sporobolomyces phaffii]